MKHSLALKVFISTLILVFMLSLGNACFAQDDVDTNDPAVQEALSHLLYADSLFEDDSSIMAAWVSYGLFKIVYIRENAPEMQEEGAYISTYEEELQARENLVKTWKEFKEKDPSLQDVYLDELLVIYNAGFLREYVWDYFNEDSWQNAPDGQRLVDFIDWQVENLPDHQALTLVAVDFEMPQQSEAE